MGGPPRRSHSCEVVSRGSTLDKTRYPVRRQLSDEKGQRSTSQFAAESSSVPTELTAVGLLTSVDTL
jgi:hypothetical protein